MNTSRFRYLFYALDALLACTGVFLIATNLALYDLFELMIRFVGSWYAVLPVLLTATGAIVVLCSLGGLFLVQNDDPRGTIAMSFVILSITLTQVALLMTVKEIDLDARDSLSQQMNRAMSRYATNDSYAVTLLDETQQRYRCCGNDVYEDWSRLLSKSVQACGNVPDSCKRQNDTVDESSLNATTYPRMEICSTIYRRGCKNLLLRHVRNGTILLRIFVFSSMFAQILVMLCLWIVAVRIDEWHAPTRLSEARRKRRSSIVRFDDTYADEIELQQRRSVRFDNGEHDDRKIYRPMWNEPSSSVAV